jgi:hypothetical protein
MVSVPFVVDRGFDPISGKPKLVFVASPLAALRRKSKDWLARNHDNMSEWGDMSIAIYELLC